jgi:primosomal protein N'
MLPPGQSSKNLANRIKEKTARFVYLKLPKEVIEKDLEEGKIKSEKHKKLLGFLLENDGIDVSELESITDVSKAVMKTVEKNGFIEFKNEKVERNPLANKTKKKDKKLVLTAEQQDAYEQINFMIENEEYSEFLLHGVTGSRENRGLFTSN